MFLYLPEITVEEKMYFLFWDAMTPFLLSQILVGMAICTDLLSFQGKQRKHILVCLIISSSLISLHFVLLEHWTAAGLGLLAGIRFVTSYFTPEITLNAVISEMIE